MKVIENNFKNKNNLVKNNPYTVITYCDNWNSKLEIAEEDTHIGCYGVRFVTCPCCGEETMIYEMDGFTLTVDNIKFPVHFHRTNKDLGAKEVYDEEIVKNIKRAIQYFRTNNRDDEWCWFTECGELFVAVYKLDGDDEYYVVVSKDFYDTYIPFEDEDRKLDGE